MHNLKQLTPKRNANTFWNDMDNIKQILEKIGYTNLKDLGSEYQTLPLYRPSDNKTALAIQKNTGLWFDFVEKTGGNLAQLVQKTLKLQDYNEAKKILTDNGLEMEAKTEGYETLITMQKTFDKSMLNKLIQKHDYWRDRGISDNTIRAFNGGITFNGRLNNRYVFPILSAKDELVGFAGRILTNNTEYCKWKIIGKKTEWVFPNQAHDSIRCKKEVILCESIGDSLSLWEVGVKNVLVLFGTSLNPAIVTFLLKYDILKIKIGLNNDEKKNSVGNKAAQQIKEELEFYFDEEQIEIVTPKFKDFNDWLVQDREGLELFCKNL